MFVFTKKRSIELAQAALSYPPDLISIHMNHS